MLRSSFGHAIFRSLEENQRVQLDISQGPKGPQAAGVTAI
jgi:CspA family cold shock protein